LNLSFTLAIKLIDLGTILTHHFTTKILNHMGLMDFFKKGKEEPVKPRQPANAPRQTTPSVQTPSSAQPTPASPAVREYTIKSGDSLSKIAKQYYGNAADWDKIYKANKDKIKDPNTIFPGQKIVIP
jgi:nucleoid-associated protein YgaU